MQEALSLVNALVGRDALVHRDTLVHLLYRGVAVANSVANTMRNAVDSS